MGVAVIVSIHKPSISELELIDYISIIRKGRQIYFGKPSQMYHYFNDVVGIEMDPTHNVLSSLFEMFILTDMSKSDNMDDKHIGRKLLKQRSDKTSHKREHLEEEFEERFSEYYIPQATREEMPFLPNDIESIQTEKYYSNYLYSVLVLLQRTFTVKARNWRTEFIAPLFEKVVFGLIIGFMYLQVERVNMPMRAKLFSFVNILISITFSLGMKTFISQIPNLVQERNSTSYRISAFYIVKSIEDFIDFTVYPLIFGLICYFMIGLTMTPDRIFTFILIFPMYTLASMSFAQALVSIIPIPSILNSIGPIINLAFIVYSGSYGFSMVPDAISWIGYLSYLTYGFRALAINEFHGVIINVSNTTTILQPSSASYFTNGTQFLQKNFGLYDDYYMVWVYFVILVVYFLICKVLGYLGLRYIYGAKSPKRLLKRLKFWKRWKQ